MKKIKVHFENCYGIKSLKGEFDFSKRKNFVVYAPNGTMKTSFAKTFQDFSANTETVDRVYSNRNTTRSITDENNQNIKSEKVFVIEPLNLGFESKRTSTLLANKKLREDYDKAASEIEDKKKRLIDELKKISGLRNGVETNFATDIASDPNEFIEAINMLRYAISEENTNNLEEIKYQKVFGNEKVLDLLKTQDFKDKIDHYIKIYDKLIGSSNFFKKGVFNHDNATDISKSLKKNGFFNANHSVFVTIDAERKEIKTDKELEEAINQEKETILQDKSLAKSFEEINKKFSNQGLKDFRDYLEENRVIIQELKNIKAFKKKLWVDYVLNSKEAYNDLIRVYDEGKKKIEEIQKKAHEDITKWHDSINTFNERFSVPFKVSIKNQIDVILKSELPNFEFEFYDSEEKPKQIEKRDLLDILSNGERRALYILHIIYEIQARIEENIETLFVIDDIADSFDYKNKYAIIEYLHDISNAGNFYQIILTHNFDFYRTISGRLSLKRENKLYAIKNQDSIELKEEYYQRNPFKTWKQELGSNHEMLVASIPFIRNLVEYCSNEEEENYKKLTSLLHIKQDTDEITLGDLEKIIKDVLKDKSNIDLNDKDKKVKNLIYELSDSILGESNEEIELEKKVVLSIAIRLQTEEFLIKEINDDSFFQEISNNQTYKLIRKYKEKFPDEKENIKLIEQVNLMTPESIHINSFMYEPILDMANNHLKMLYNKIKESVFLTVSI